MMGTSGSYDYPTTIGCFDNSFNGGTPGCRGVGINHSNGCNIVVSRFLQMAHSFYLQHILEEALMTVSIAQMI